MSTLRALKLSGIVKNTSDCVFPASAAAPVSVIINAKVMGKIDENSPREKPFFPAPRLTADDCVHPNTLGGSKVRIATPPIKPKF